MAVTTHPLLGDLSDVPQNYIRGVAETKRFLERWTMDPSFQHDYADDPEAALAALGVSLRPENVEPHIDRVKASLVTAALARGELDACPDSVVAYRAFIAEKVAHRSELRSHGDSTDPRLAAWRHRQIRRAQTELGVLRSEAIVHAPLSIELSKGCTVGCWFCGVAAPRFDHNWSYAENAQLWRDCLDVLRDVVGTSVRNGFLYWATDPLDNPDYESFLADFYDILGRCPQTTTAQGPKDIERTRALLLLAHSMDSAIDRFSIIALNHLHRLHENFTAAELLRIECIPQNKEAGSSHLKSNSGRARTFSSKRAAELVSDEASSTIACVSGFLFNMVDRRVQLITPCNASDRWPLGYWVVDEGHFDTAEELREVLTAIIDRSVRAQLVPGDVVRLRRDLAIVDDAGDVFAFSVRGLRVSFGPQSDRGLLVDLLLDGTRTAEDIALERLHAGGIPLAWTYALLGGLFDSGLLDEEPEPRSFEDVMRRPQRVAVSIQ